MSERKTRTLLVHESAFDFAPADDEAQHRNAGVITFIRDAFTSRFFAVPEKDLPEIPVYKVIVVSNGDPDDLKQKLAGRNLSELYREECQIDQSFLNDLIVPIDVLPEEHIDVVLTGDEVILSLIESYDLIVDPDQARIPNYFHDFEEWYEENAMHAGSQRWMSGLRAYTALKEVEVATALRSSKINLERAWGQAVSKPHMRKLVDYHSEKRWKNGAHPQDQLIENLRKYLETAFLLATGKQVGANSSVLEMTAWRHGLCQDFVSYAYFQKGIRKVIQKLILSLLDCPVSHQNTAVWFITLYGNYTM